MINYLSNIKLFNKRRTKMSKNTKAKSDLDPDQTPLANKDDGDQNTDTQGRDVTGSATAIQPDRGEQLAQEAVEKRSPKGGEVHGEVGKGGVTTVVVEPLEDQSDNGKTYKSDKIVPRDTNAPDAGLTPDGRRIAD
jgi:hypothetical protein